MSTMIEAFLPSNVSTILMSIGAAAVNVRLPGAPANPAPNWRAGGEYLEISNRGTTNVYVETSPGMDTGAAAVPSVVAVVPVAGVSNGGYWIGPGQCKIIRRAPGDSHLSAIGDAAGPSVICISLGNGI